jgi:hypothetical protein
MSNYLGHGLGWLVLDSPSLLCILLAYRGESTSKRSGLSDDIARTNMTDRILPGNFCIFVVKFIFLSLI